MSGGRAVRRTVCAALVVAGVVISGGAPAWGQADPGTATVAPADAVVIENPDYVPGDPCDPAMEPCDVPVCDPAMEPCDVPVCDPAMEPCDVPVCDPAMEPCDVPVCDPAMEPCEDGPPECGPDPGECFGIDGMPPPVAALHDETCVYEYDADGVGSCYSNGIFCMVWLYDDLFFGHEACVAGAVVEAAPPTGPVTSAKATAAGAVGSVGPPQLPATGMAAGQLSLIGLLLVATGGLLVRRDLTARHT